MDTPVVERVKHGAGQGTRRFNDMVASISGSIRPKRSRKKMILTDIAALIGFIAAAVAGLKFFHRKSS